MLHAGSIKLNDYVHFKIRKLGIISNGRGYPSVRLWVTLEPRNYGELSFESAIDLRSFDDRSTVCEQNMKICDMNGG